MRLMLIFLSSLSVLASEDHHKLPAGVLSFDDHSGEFTLDPRAVKNFGIQCAAFPPAEIVYSRYTKTAFRCSGKTFTEVALEKISSGESVVVTGAKFLKTVRLSLEEGPSEGHGH